MRTLLLLVVLLTGCVHSEAPVVPTGEAIATTAAESARKQQSADNPTLYATSEADEPAVEGPDATVPIRVEVIGDGSYRVNGQATGRDALEASLRALPAGQPIHVEAHDATTESVTFAVDAAKAAGHSEILLVPATQDPALTP